MSKLTELIARWNAAPYHTKERRHLRRAILRELERQHARELATQRERHTQARRKAGQ